MFKTSERSTATSNPPVPEHSSLEDDDSDSDSDCVPTLFEQFVDEDAESDDNDDASGMIHK